MGNYRFRLSDMIPNSWFYKLRDMGTTGSRIKTTSKFRHTPSSISSSSSSSLKLQPHHLSLSHHRKSYHVTRPNSPINPASPPPRKSSSRRRRSLKRYPTATPHVSTNITAGCSCRASMESVWNKAPDSTPDQYTISPPHTTCSTSSDHDSVVPECGSDTIDIDDDDDDAAISCSTPCKCKPQNDIIIEMGNANTTDKLDTRLPPIITKNCVDEPTKIQRTSAQFSAYGSLRVKVVKEDIVKDETVKTGKRLSAYSSPSPGVRLRTNSPRILNRRGRKSTSSNSGVSDSFAVVKSSKNPRRDFRESMVEMIVENNIRASKDLEELLACYLSLNANEYHDMIINVFKQIWFDYIAHLAVPLPLNQN